MTHSSPPPPSPDPFSLPPRRTTSHSCSTEPFFEETPSSKRLISPGTG